MGFLFCNFSYQTYFRQCDECLIVPQSTFYILQEIVSFFLCGFYMRLRALIIEWLVCIGCIIQSWSIKYPVLKLLSSNTLSFLSLLGEIAKADIWFLKVGGGDPNIQCRHKSLMVCYFCKSCFVKRQMRLIKRHLCIRYMRLT